MILYQPDDPSEQTQRATALIAARSGPVLSPNSPPGPHPARWRDEFLARFTHPDVSNGPIEDLNLKIKNTKRVARGYGNFTNYRLRLLLNHGHIQRDHSPTRVRTRRPSLAA